MPLDIIEPDLHLREVIEAHADAHSQLCWTCGTCDAECPIFRATGRLQPQKMVRMANLGLMTSMLNLPDSWYCLSCRRAYLAPNIPEGMPPRCECGGVLKPDTVLFGEPLPPEALERACTEAQTCGVMLVIGTSAVVYPAASLPHLARQRGAVIVEINIENAFPDPDYRISEPAGLAMTRLLAAVKRVGALRQ